MKNRLRKYFQMREYRRRDRLQVLALRTYLQSKGFTPDAIENHIQTD